MLNKLTLALIQNATDAQRFVQLGLAEEKVCVTGNIKFDLSLTDEQRQRAAELKRQLLESEESISKASNSKEKIIWIAASTHHGEDEIILDAFSDVREALHGSARELLLILVPRHPERFERVGQLCLSRGFSIARRSRDKTYSGIDILLGDTMGELMVLFGAADIAFVGGSLVPNGGHNFIEPAAWGLPLLSGEHLFNFAEVSALLQSADALDIAKNKNELVAQLKHLILDSALRNEKGQRALRVAMENRGALDKTLAKINAVL